MLKAQPLCTDAAIAAIEQLAVLDPAARNDLAAAYALRASREDRPSDLLNALDTAQQAAAAAPHSAAAWFNRAVIEESLGLTAEAIESWNVFLKIGNGPHAAEARQYRDFLTN